MKMTGYTLEQIRWEVPLAALLLISAGWPRPTMGDALGG